LEVGAWIDINGEAIYGTSPWRVTHEGDAAMPIRFTAKGDAVYAICLAWPGGKEVVVKALGKRALPDKSITSARMLGSSDEVNWQQSDDGLTLTVPPKAPCQHAFVYRINLAGNK